VNSATLEAAKLGNRKALSELLTSLQDVWFRFALNLLRDQELAADATQETALRFMRQLPSFRGASQLKTWSLGIALNVVREMRRSRRESVETDFDAIPTGEEPSDASDLAEQRQNVKEALQHLGERQREAIVLRFFEDLSMEQTAKAMDCAVGTAKATIHQAIRALRSKMRIQS